MPAGEVARPVISTVDYLPTLRALLGTDDGTPADERSRSNTLDGGAHPIEEPEAAPQATRARQSP
ncbi:MAG TPA: hypothetical protein VLH79_14785 [Chthonomonadales bacterium]|nr:hypothetical protein [Chthonomonadales bacterium]